MTTRTADASPETAPRRMATWPLVLGGVAMLMLAAGWFAPLIVAGTPLLNHFVSQATPEFRGKIDVGGASLGWFSPVELQRIRVYDEQGELLAKVESILVRESLVDLLQDTGRLSKVTVDRPHLRLVVRKDGSNLEDALAPLLAAPASGKPLPRPLIEVTGGSAEIVDAESQKTWKAEDLAATVTPGVSDEPWKAELSAALESAAGNKQPLSATATFLLPTDKGLGNGGAEMKSDALPLDLIAFLAGRVAPGISAQGQAAGRLTAKWSEEPSSTGASPTTPVIALGGELRGQGVRIAAPDYLGPDRLDIGGIVATGGVEIRGNRYTARDVNVQTDVASLRASGSATSDLLRSGSPLDALAKAAATEDFELAARIDLARLAKQLPSVVKLREGTQLTAGQIEATLAGSRVADASGTPGKRTWIGRVSTSKVSAIDNGRVLTWDDPLRISLAAYDTGTGIVLEKLACEASFLQLAAQGTREQGKLTAQGDLDRLAAELGRFLDLSGVRLAGKLQGELAWLKQANGMLAANADVSLTQWQLALPQKPAWTEPELRAQAQAVLALPNANQAIPNGPGGPFNGVSLQTAQAVLIAQQDRLDLSLTKPVENFSLTAPLPVKIRCRGELSRWVPRLAPVVTIPVGLSGTFDLDATASVSTQSIELAPTVIQVAQLVVATPDLQIEDPQVRIETSGVVDLASGQIRSPETTVTGTTISLRATQLTAATTGRVTGDFAYRGDLNRIQRWFPATQTAASTQYTGQIAGTAALVQEAGLIRGQLDATIDQLSLLQLDAPPAAPRVIPASNGPPVWKTLWAEPRIVVKADGNYDLAKDLLTLGGAGLNNGAAQVTAAGSIAGLQTRPMADLTGELTTDLALLAQRFRGLLGPVQMEGRETRPFAIRGPLTVTALATADPNAQPGFPPQPPLKPFVSPELQAQGGFGWTAIQAQGLAFGPGVLDGRLNQGVLQFAPLDVAVGQEGRLRGAGALDLRGPSPVLSAAPGKVLENIRFSPDLCRSWLKYVTPILADVTTIEGQFSVQLNEATVPLFEPTKATARGVLLVQGAHAGPGPVGQSFLGLLKQLKAIIDRKGLLTGSPNQQTWIDLQDQQVEFQLIDGRVHHRGMSLIVGNVPMRTAGSVGLDQSLDVKTEVPILDQWVQKDPLLGGLRGQSLTIPLRGTLLAPKADGKVIKDLAEKLTGGLINDILRPVLPGVPQK